MTDLTVRLMRVMLAIVVVLCAAFTFAIGWTGIGNLNLLRVTLAWLISFFALGLALVIAREAIRSSDRDSPVFGAPGAYPGYHRLIRGTISSGVILPPSPERCAVVIERRRQWMNRLGSMEIYLDRLWAASASDGEAVQFEVHPGHHEIQIRFQSERSPVLAVDLRPGEATRLECGSLIAGWRWFIAPYVYLRRHSLYLTTIPDGDAVSVV